MKYYNILDFKLHEMHVFTTAAEYQSITKAADFLYLTPSEVSKTIKKLEQQWGIQLFIREKNTIRLTPAGKHAYAGLNRTINSIEKVLNETQSVQKVTPFIRVGCPTLSNPNELIVPVVKRFLNIYPEASVTIECEDTLAELRKKLIGGAVDVIFTSEIELSESVSVLEWRSIEAVQLYVIMNCEHPLAKKKSIEWENIELEEFVFLNPMFSMSTDYIAQRCRHHGFTPRVAFYTPNIYSQLMAVHINPKVICLQSIKGLKNDDGLCWHPLKNMSWDMGFAYRKEAPKLVVDFVNCAGE